MSDPESNEWVVDLPYLSKMDVPKPGDLWFVCEAAFWADQLGKIPTYYMVVSCYPFSDILHHKEKIYQPSYMITLLWTGVNEVTSLNTWTYSIRDWENAMRKKEL